MEQTQIPTFSQLGIDLTDLVLPWMAAVLVFVVILLLKDLAVRIAKGLQFKYNPAFNEGDRVILDGQDSIIVKVGFIETVFGLYTEKGYTWRYVPNERIPFLKLERVINPHLHPDTAEERALKIQRLISKAQDEIEQNKKDISNLKTSG